MTPRRRFVSSLSRPWPSLLAWVGLVFVASSVPLPKGPDVDFPLGLDKIGHGLTYAVLGALAVRVLAKRNGWSVLGVVLSATAYGALLEGCQHLIGRHAELADLAANTAGAALGALTAVAFSRRGPRGRSHVKERSNHGKGGRTQAD